MPSPFQTNVFNNPLHIDLLQKYLDDRCLEPSDFPEGLVPILNRQLLADRGYNANLSFGRPFIFLQYLDPHGNPYFEPSDTEKLVPHAAARFLGEPIGYSGAKPPPKMLSPNGRPNQLHFEPIRPLEGESRDWYNLPDGQIVVHVESLIKARAVSKWTTYPTVGYNGVESYSSSKRGIELIHNNYDVDFSRFDNVILFDANTKYNENIKRARLGLMFKLRNILGAKTVRFVELPDVNGDKKAGPDDFLREYGNEALIELIKNAETYVGEEHEDLIQEMMAKAVYCTKSSTIIDVNDKEVRSEQKAASFYAPVNKKVLKGRNLVSVAGFPLWRESKDRREVVNPGYEYLGAEFLRRDDGEYYNLYKASGPWPEHRSSEEPESTGAQGVFPGSPGATDRLLGLRPFQLVKRQLENMMSSEDLRLVRAYLKFLKFTGRKPTSFPVLFSDKRGVGKGWVSKLAYRLLGASNSTSADARAFVSNFNAQLANKRLVIINEFKVNSTEKAAAMNSIKRFFGDELITIEPKGVDSYQLENRAGMIVTCNALEDVPTDGFEDRRMWYVDCANKEVVDRAGWSLLHEALDDPGTVEDLFWWIKDAENIDFATWLPPLDESKRRAILEGSSSLEAACTIVLEDLREMDVICLMYPAVANFLKPEYPRVVETAGKAVTSAMKRSQWKVSDKKYGRNGEQKVVWIIDEKRFETLTGKEITEECDRVLKLSLGHSKY